MSRLIAVLDANVLYGIMPTDLPITFAERVQDWQAGYRCVDCAHHAANFVGADA